MSPSRIAGFWAPAAAAFAAMLSVPGSSAFSGPRVETSDIDITALRSGDLVFRAGRGWEADAVRLASFGTFSHVGMVDIAADGTVYIVHAAPPEHGGHGRVERVPLETFNDARYASDIVFYRRADLPEATALEAAARARIEADRGTPFDDQFDAGDQSKLYCTELIMLAFADSGAALPFAFAPRIDGSILGNIVYPADFIRSGEFVRVDARRS
ncbi:YiiX/YebB-like N1pC/P60 family cysteine hydrolase [uncultured Parasphingopyxis sp.]|uniref:YiiX/YebB-like N1pC/P60 family cysteine hydrolase n=1 Tax=uncultured Parasphingopyxis sp. TaxID=1547918 RepID=UPI002625E287|nr:YiiX/YebB-like N1pC/P60 family cysteine hydrolase [uncultured Parasphingopyxis sp.]